MVFIFDTIHGYISFTEKEKPFIDNRWMKRLKRIKQLGLLDHVFPSASHSRFEHSIGVSYLADAYIQQLVQNSPQFKPSVIDVMCVKLAGLFHDVGHGPFSHVFDNILIKDSSLHHEKRSRQIVEYIFKEIGTRSGLSSAYMIDYIKEMIEPMHNNYLESTENPSRRPLFSIVNNTINNIDVDKMDYLQRDPNHIGLDYSFNYGRIFNKSYVINGNIVYHSSIASNIVDLFTTRYRFHKDIYNHKTVKLIEMMLGDALLSANDTYNFTDISQTPEFITLDDNIYSQILFSNEPELAESKHLLERIESRQLYKQLWAGNLQSESEIQNYIEDNLQDHRRCDIRHINMKFNLCNGNQSPLEKVLFTQDKQNYYKNSQSVSSILPHQYEEQTVMIYSVK
jgi:deoxynucleoside triphosphate triphosphohydrolase SAMHD1